MRILLGAWSCCHYALLRVLVSFLPHIKTSCYASLHAVFWLFLHYATSRLWRYVDDEMAPEYWALRMVQCIARSRTETRFGFLFPISYASYDIREWRFYYVLPFTWTSCPDCLSSGLLDGDIVQTLFLLVDDRDEMRPSIMIGIERLPSAYSGGLPRPGL